MQKRVLFILTTTFFTLLGGVNLYAQSCPTQFGGTTFQPKSGVTATYYDLSDVSFVDPTSENITFGTGYSFQNTSPASLSTSRYTISKTDGLVLHCREIDQFGFFSYQLSGLLTAAGRNSYKVEIVFSAVRQSGCSTSIQDWNNYIKMQCTPVADAQYKTINFGTTYTYSYTFTATSSSQTFAFSSDYSNGCGLLSVKSIKVTGCFDKTIVSSNGNKVCAGELNTLTAKGLTGASYTWEQSIDNKSTWQPLVGNQQSIDVEVKTDTYYRVTSGTEILVSDLIRPIVCCAVSGERQTMSAEQFTFTGTRTSNASCQYTYKSSGNIDEGQYAVVHSAADGGYWTNRTLRGHTTNGGVDDGFILVNAARGAGMFYEQYINNQLCENTIYDFSAFIANACPDDGKVGRVPVNAGFKVFGCTAPGNCPDELLSVESGNLPDGTNWTEKGGSFNSGSYKSVNIQIFNNIEAPGTGAVDGNDIAIDDITFSTCSPEIKMYSNSALTSQDTIVCDDGNDVALSLIAAAVYDMKDFFLTPYYLMQQSSSQTGPWTQVGTAQTSNTFAITVPATLTTKIYYRTWVAGDQTTVEKVSQGQPVSGCGSVSAVTDPIAVSYHCNCKPTTPPIVNAYSECPCQTGTSLLADLVTSDKTQLRFYSDATGGTALPATKKFDCRTVHDTIYYVTNQLANTLVDEYCESDRVPINIHIKDAVQFTVSPKDITTCLTNGVNLTYTISNIVPANAQIKWGTTPESFGTTYTLSASEGSGTINIEATDPSACLATDAVTYELLNTPDFTLSAPTMVCVSNPVAEIKAQVSAGTGSYQWFKNDVEVANGTMMPGQTEITYNDAAVATAEGSVTYKLKLDNGICFTEKTVSVSVGDRIDIPVTASAPAQNNTICLGATIDLTAGYTLNAGESLTWTVGGVVLPETGTVLASQQPTANTTYLVSLVGGTCEGDGSITINVDTPPAPAITVDKDVICEGTQVNITDSDPNTATRYVWMQEISPYAYQDISQQTGKDITGFQPTVTAKYKKISYNGVCSTESNEITVTVYPAIVFNIEPIGRTICEGENITITMSGYPTGSTTEWFEKATSSLISSDPSTVVTPTQTTIYTARVTNICTAEKDLTVSVLPPINPQISQPTSFCLGDSTILTVSGNGITSYSWVPSSSLDSPNEATTVARPKTDTQYIVTVSNGVCEVTATTNVHVNPLPLFDTIEEQNTENCTTRSVTVTAKEGTPPYQFSEDGNNFITQNVFTGMTSGWNKLFVIDANTCKGDTSFYLAPYPIIPDRLVTPNNDNTNELWTVENLNCYSAYIVEIFDRYGKRLYEWRKGSYSKSSNSEDFPGWDGIYNGHQLPSTDYWYLITVEEIRKQYNGHFILKR
ncbi:MAG: T9SS type B sorting domain-containing protein [Bacteroidia bacterium]|nr:T9SS type B sorting domain-containing protein [Bacteroidia bacterium]